MPDLKSVKFDMLSQPFIENLLIYTENLSFFYFICALVSFFAVWYTWNIEPSTHKEEAGEDTNSGENFFSENSDESIYSDDNTAIDKKVLMKSIESTLTNDDRVKESEYDMIEKIQLMDILEVMKKDEKFKSTTMEELQEQLKLYRE